MAQIYIKRKKEPLVISNTRAIALKKMWIENPKSSDLIDLGDWSGELAQIVSIEMDSDTYKVPTVKDFAEENVKNRQAILATPPEKRAKFLERFKLIWFTRSGLTEKETPQDVLDKVEKIQLEYYTKEPKAYFVPSVLYEPILFARWGVKRGQNSVQMIAKKMEVDMPKEPVSDIPF